MSQRDDLVLPEEYVLLDGEKLVEITPEDKVPQNYIAGPDIPDDGEQQINANKAENGEPTYWYDLRNNVVKIAVVVGNKSVEWEPCDAMKLCVDLHKTPVVAIGKIIGTPPGHGFKQEPRITFREAAARLRVRKGGAPDDDEEQRLHDEVDSLKGSTSGRITDADLDDED